MPALPAFASCRRLLAAVPLTCASALPGLTGAIVGEGIAWTIWSARSAIWSSPTAFWRKEDVVDAYGHVSIRHPQQARPLPAVALAQPGVRHPRRHHRVHARRHAGRATSRPAYLERFIHGAIYEARPDVNAVVHSHAEDILPFSISKTPLCCVAHVASDMGTHVPVWDIADKFGDETNLLVINMAQGRDMARVLGGNTVVLMRGHGFSAAADGLLKLVRLCGLPAAQRPHPAGRHADGRVQGACPRARSAPATGFRAGSPEMQRGWEYWARRAGCGDMLGRQQGRGLSAWRRAPHRRPLPSDPAVLRGRGLCRRARARRSAAIRTGRRSWRSRSWTGSSIATALTSLAQPGVQFCKPAEAKALARRCNDYAAELNAQLAKRFGAFGTVSMWDVARRGGRDRPLPRHAEVLRRQPVREL